MPLCQGESVTPKCWDGLTEACADGKTKQIFGTNEIDTETTGLEKIRKNQQKLDYVTSRTTSDFGAF